MTGSEGDVDTEDFPPAALPEKTRREFLLQAGLLNVGVLATGAGVIVVVFTQQVFEGVLLTGLGILLLGLTVRRYHQEAPPK